MNWMMIVGVGFAIALIIRWDKRNFIWTAFLKDFFIVSTFVLLFNLIADYITTEFGMKLSLLNYIPDTLYIWLGGFILFAFASMLSYKVWNRDTKK